jgi:hypothetical protein
MFVQYSLKFQWIVIEFLDSLDMHRYFVKEYWLNFQWISIDLFSLNIQRSITFTQLPQLNINGFLEHCSVSRVYQWHQHILVTVRCTSDSGMYQWQWRVPVTVACTSDSGVYQWQWRVPVTVACTSDSGMYQWQWRVPVTVACNNDSCVN